MHDQKKIFVGIQSRLNSSRFPRKAFTNILGKPLLQHVINRIEQIKFPLEIAVLTPKNEKEEFEQFLSRSNCHIPVFGGSENNVLERFYYAAKEFNANNIIMRVTGDNPLISIVLAEELIELHNNNIDLSHFIGNPLGTGIELISFNALEKSFQESTDPFEQEHVTPYIYRNPEKFNILEPINLYHSKYKDQSLSIDYPEDIEKIETILLLNHCWDINKE